MPMKFNNETIRGRHNSLEDLLDCAKESALPQEDRKLKAEISVVSRPQSNPRFTG